MSTHIRERIRELKNSMTLNANCSPCNEVEDGGCPQCWTPNRQGLEEIILLLTILHDNTRDESLEREINSVRFELSGISPTQD